MKTHNDRIQELEQRVAKIEDDVKIFKINPYIEPSKPDYTCGICRATDCQKECPDPSNVKSRTGTEDY